MRARLKFTTDFVEETLIGVLKDHHWWPHFPQDEFESRKIIDEISDSVDESDVDLFRGSRKYVLSHTGTESKGTISLEHKVWVVRLLNPNIHLLQLACEVLVAQVAEHAGRNHKAVTFVGPIQIVERKRKETIIEGQPLATPKNRLEYARTHRRTEFGIAGWGVVALVLLLLITFPWPFRDFTHHAQSWAFSVFEKFIGSVAVTSSLAYVQYRSFLNTLREHTVRWSIPGEPEKLEVRSHAA